MHPGAEQAALGESVAAESSEGQEASVVALTEKWQAPKDTEPDTSALGNAIVSAAELDAMSLPDRECFVGTWFRSAGSGMVFAPRGLGKTWFALGLAASLAEGRDFGPWSIPKTRRVLYVDGEMHVHALQERLRGLRNGSCDGLHILSHEIVFRKFSKGLDLAETLVQNEIGSECERKCIDVLILDNLSCLFYGIRENEADDCEIIQRWLLALRNKGIAVVLVHHAGKNGQQRGTSKREGPVSFLLNLTAPSGGDEKPGCHFVATFTKNRDGDPRNAQSEEGPWLIHFDAGNDGKTSIVHERVVQMDRFLSLVRDGLTSCKDIAEEMGVSKGTVSKWAKKASKTTPPQIKIDTKGRYLPVE